MFGGKGTLAQCISKEVFGDEDVELPIRCALILMQFKIWCNLWILSTVAIQYYKYNLYASLDIKLLCSFTENNLERSLQIVADWTGFPINIFQNYKENCSWELKTPITCVKATNCRYFNTLFLQKENGNQYVDRIISKTGCNCMLAPPYVAKKVDGKEWCLRRNYMYNRMSHR